MHNIIGLALVFTALGHTAVQAVEAVEEATVGRVGAPTQDWRALEDTFRIDTTKMNIHQLQGNLSSWGIRDLDSTVESVRTDLEVLFDQYHEMIDSQSIIEGSIPDGFLPQDNPSAYIRDGFLDVTTVLYQSIYTHMPYTAEKAAAIRREFENFKTVLSHQAQRVIEENRQRTVREFLQSDTFAHTMPKIYQDAIYLTSIEPKDGIHLNRHRNLHLSTQYEDAIRPYQR